MGLAGGHELTHGARRFDDSTMPRCSCSPTRPWGATFSLWLLCSALACQDQLHAKDEQLYKIQVCVKKARRTWKHANHASTAASRATLTPRVMWNGCRNASHAPAGGKLHKTGRSGRGGCGRSEGTSP